MNKLLRIFSLCTAFFVMPYAQASDDQADITFDQGIVLVICAPPEGIELTTEQFNKAFPDWIAVLQMRANEGVITRAHYMGELKAGIFIVVEGKDKDNAMANALGVSEELNDIYRKTTGSEETESCNFREIGPVAILPQ